jgi:pimeloyl-ACP methyl ester carboxylesterase
MRRAVLVLVVAAILGALGGAAAFVRHPFWLFERLGKLALRSAGLARTEVVGPRGRLVYWRGGSGPVLVLLHGANDQAGAWGRVAKPLASSHHLIVPDLAGHGESEPGEGPLTVADLLAGVEALLDAERVGERAALVGNSMGGWLALLTARAHPERVGHVVLVNGAAIRGDGPPAAISLLPKTRDEARRAMDALLDPASPRVAAFVLDDLVRRAPTSPLARLLPSAASPEHALDGRLSQIGTPVTLLWGESDRLMPVAYAERVARELPAARLEVLPRCGHMPQRECPDGLVRALERALREPPGEVRR